MLAHHKASGLIRKKSCACYMEVSFLNIWTPQGTCRSAFSHLLLFRPLCKMVHEVAQGTGSLMCISSVHGHAICAQHAALEH